MKSLNAWLSVALSVTLGLIASSSSEAGTLEVTTCREIPIGTKAKCGKSLRQGTCRYGVSFDGRYQYFSMTIDSGAHAGTYQGIIANEDWGPEGTRPVKIDANSDGRIGDLKFDSHYKVIRVGYGDINIGREHYYRYRCRQ